MWRQFFHCFLSVLQETVKGGRGRTCFVQVRQQEKVNCARPNEINTLVLHWFFLIGHIEVSLILPVLSDRRLPWVMDLSEVSAS